MFKSHKTSTNNRIYWRFWVLLLLGMFVGVLGWGARVAVAQSASTYSRNLPLPPQETQSHASSGQSVPGTSTPDNVLIILDASSSMSEKLPTGELKIVAAKRAILEVLKMIPPHVNVGLRVYGQSASTFTACRSTRLLVPVTQGNRHDIANRLVKVRPVGPTPITYTLNRAVKNDFKNLPGTKSIILVSDGEETCEGDPCSLAVAMVRNGVDVKIDVIGFGLYDMSAIRQLKCIALSTFGKFHQADTSADLARRMNEAIQVKTDVQAQILIPGQRNTSPIAGPQFAPNGILYQNRPIPSPMPPPVLPPLTPDQP